MTRRGSYTDEQLSQVILVLNRNIGIGGMHISHQFLFYDVDNAVISKPGHKTGHIEINDGIFVQMLVERKMVCYLQVGKQLARLARTVIVGAEHFRRQRLAESAASRHTAEPSLGEKRTIHNGY